MKGGGQESLTQKGPSEGGHGEQSQAGTSSRELVVTVTALVPIPDGLFHLFQGPFDFLKLTPGLLCS